MAECRGIAPHARRHALFSKQARSACPIDIPNWPAEPKLDRATVGPRGRTRTCTLEGLSFVPLHWATRGWCPRSDSHRYCARFKCAVSALDYVGKLVPREGFPLWWPCASTLSVLSGASLVVGLTRRKLPLPEGLSPTSPTFEASRSGN